MVDGAPRRPCKYHPRLNGANFCGEGTGHFRSSGRQIWKLIWNKHKIVAWSYGPYIYTKIHDYLNMVFDDPVSLHGSCKTMPSHWSTGKVSTCCPSTEYTCFTLDRRGWVIFRYVCNHLIIAAFMPIPLP